jgi:ParB family chromosome partitioning protein
MRELKTVSVDSIQPEWLPPIRPIDEPHITNLMSSIKSYGIMSPLVVTGPNSKTGKYYLVFGSHRLEAAKRLGKPKVPVIVKKCTKQEALFLQFEENLQRKDMTPMQEARWFESILGKIEGLTAKKLAERIRRDASYVSHRLALLRMHEDVIDALEKGLIRLSDARRLQQCSLEDQSAAVMNALRGNGLIEVPVEPSAVSPEPSAVTPEPVSGPATKRSVSNDIRKEAASRVGQRPGAANKSKTFQERYDGAKPRILESI